MARNRELHLSVANIGDSQYLTDHYHRAREALLFLSFTGGESVAEIREAIETEISDCDKIPASRKASEKTLDSVANEICAEIAYFPQDDESLDCDGFDVQVLATW
jgi:hypothetical protein